MLGEGELVGHRPVPAATMTNVTKPNLITSVLRHLRNSDGPTKPTTWPHTVIHKNNLCWCPYSRRGWQEIRSLGCGFSVGPLVVEEGLCCFGLGGYTFFSVLSLSILTQ